MLAVGVRAVIAPRSGLGLKITGLPLPINGWRWKATDWLPQAQTRKRSSPSQGPKALKARSLYTSLRKIHCRSHRAGKMPISLDRKELLQKYSWHEEARPG